MRDVHEVIQARRDVRNGFRQDPIPPDVLLRILTAAHHAPSVGFSQPWDFLLIESVQTRQRVQALVERARLDYLASLPAARARQFNKLKIEAILDTPLNIVVTCDPTRGGHHVLGRATQPKMAEFSAACAVQNLWLAARAEDVGVGWISFFDERTLAELLGLPEHISIVAYLAVGYVDGFAQAPELATAGWATRRPLAWAIRYERWDGVMSSDDTVSTVLSDTVAAIRPVDTEAAAAARDRQERLTKPRGSLGYLEDLSVRLCGLAGQCPAPVPEPAVVTVFAADHGVHAQGVSPWPQEVTAQMVANFLAGGAVINAIAAQVGAEVLVVDLGVNGGLPTMPGLLNRKIRPGTADMTLEPAMTREQAVAAIEVGIELARDLIAAGNRCLIAGDMGIANTTASAALISVFTRTAPAEVTGRGTGATDDMLGHKIEVIERALARHQSDAGDPIGVLAAVGGLEHAGLAGLMLGAAALRTPVILDGVISGAAALVAAAIAPDSVTAMIAGHRSVEPGAQLALTQLRLRPLLDLDLRLGEGSGAALVLGLVQSSARVLRDVATFDGAGVTDKDER